MIDVNNYFSSSFFVHGGGHDAGGGIAGVMENVLTFLESLVGLSPAEIFSVILPGFSSLANIHPIVVHFPIALLLLFFIIDFFGSVFKNDNWRNLACSLLYLGTIAAAAAVAAGLMAAGSVEHGENVHLIMEKHEMIGISVLSLSLLLSIWRLLSGGIVRGTANVFFLIFAAILNILLLLGADLGGMMVYQYGVAVDAVEVETMDYFQEHSHSHDHEH